jgi:hypothetical protein
METVLAGKQIPFINSSHLTKSKFYYPGKGKPASIGADRLALAAAAAVYYLSRQKIIYNHRQL